jgi:hypothetical protein
MYLIQINIPSIAASPSYYVDDVSPSRKTRYSNHFDDATSSTSSILSEVERELMLIGGSGSSRRHNRSRSFEPKSKDNIFLCLFEKIFYFATRRITNFKICCGNAMAPHLKNWSSNLMSPLIQDFKTTLILFHLEVTTLLTSNATYSNILRNICWRQFVCEIFLWRIWLQFSVHH